ncbi:MAG TPA: beta-ketoacyl-ACP synthase II [Candidatus Acidoferrales bacterium]|nr:beta-ketoacyl-ACP synthase II [Candidatus Acidoferrales bacterium]
MSDNGQARVRVAITGMGLVTPIGTGIEAVWESLTQGRSGIDTIAQFDASAYPTRMAAEVRDFNPELYMDRKTARHVARYCRLGLAAARMALADSGLKPEELGPDDVGVVVSSGAGGMEEIERGHQVLIDRGIGRISPFMVPMMITDIAAGLIAIELRCGGPNYAVVSACASSAHALGDAAEVIRRGDAIAMIAGGAEAPITPLLMGAFCQLSAMSRRNDDPAGSSRPFDLNRDGFVMGEGAVIMVLEEMEYAKARGARIWAELLGCGATSDMYHFTAPDPQGHGAARAMQKVMRTAGLAPEDIDYVNAHGTSTPLGDLAETLAIKQALGDRARQIPISSTKSMSGHLLGAAGALEAAACVLAIAKDVVPPTINLELPDPDCDLDYVPNRARPARIDVALSNSFGFGGHNACLALGRVAA